MGPTSPELSSPYIKVLWSDAYLELCAHAGKAVGSLGSAVMLGKFQMASKRQ